MRKILTSLLILLSITVFGQKDSVILLESFTKVAKKMSLSGHFTKSDNEIKIPKERINESLDALIEDETTNYINSYGPNYLSTVSIRGSNSQQVAIIYENFVLNNPLNGVVDLTTIPLSFFHSADIVYGLPSSSSGNGGVSGAIILNNNLQESNNSLELGSVLGSYGKQNQYFNINTNYKKIQTSLKFFRNASVNNFMYKDEFQEIQKQQNASQRQLAMMSESTFQFSKRSSLSLILIHQDLQREIPPTLFEDNSVATQYDKNSRLFCNYKFQGKNSLWTYSSSLHNEENTYTDSIRGIEGFNPITSLINRIELKRSFSKLDRFNFSAMNTLANSSGNNYIDPIKMNRSALTSSYLIVTKNKKWEHLFNGRIVLNDNIISPMTYSYSTSYSLPHSVRIYGNFGKVYRFPTLNDLYWYPGGNPDLLPENGYSADLGCKWMVKWNESNSLSIEVNGYSRIIDNWIQWLPNGQLWSPLNIKKVYSRGMETSSKFQKEIKKFRFEISVKTSYNLSTNMDIYQENVELLNKQLIYCPYYKGVIKTSIFYKKLTLSYYHNYTGYRFTTADNSTYLPAIHLGKIYLKYKSEVFGQDYNLFYKINNLYNTNYQLVLNRPMPLLNHEIGINIKLMNPINRK